MKSWEIINYKDYLIIYVYILTSEKIGNLNINTGAT